jgi:hypothetical protein
MEKLQMSLNKEVINRTETKEKMSQIKKEYEDKIAMLEIDFEKGVVVKETLEKVIENHKNIKEYIEKAWEIDKEITEKALEIEKEINEEIEK